jgi:hypothetical protein
MRIHSVFWARNLCNPKISIGETNSFVLASDGLAKPFTAHEPQGERPVKNFRDYLTTRRSGNNPAGQFTRQVRNDPEIEKIESWPELRAYIYRKAHADKINATITAAEPVWKGYRAYVLKHRRTQ